MMKCPKDGAALSAVQVGNIPLDKCHQCDGIWFDPGELEKLRTEAPSEVEEDLERQYGSPETDGGELDRYMGCPRCPEGRLRSHTFSYMIPVKIDRCTECRGIWLDDNEFNSLVADKEKAEEQVGLLKSLFRALNRGEG